MRLRVNKTTNKKLRISEPIRGRVKNHQLETLSEYCFDSFSSYEIPVTFESLLDSENQFNTFKGTDGSLTHLTPTGEISPRGLFYQLLPMMSVFELDLVFFFRDVLEASDLIEPERLFELPK